MTTKIIKQPHGYGEDSDGRVCFRFANYRTGIEHAIPDAVDMRRGITYVDGPASHPPLHEAYL